MLNRKKIDIIIVSTVTPDMFFLQRMSVQDKSVLKMPGIYLIAACSGFLFALRTALHL